MSRGNPSGADNNNPWAPDAADSKWVEPRPNELWRAAPTLLAEETAAKDELVQKEQDAQDDAAEDPDALLPAESTTSGGRTTNFRTKAKLLRWAKRARCTR